MIEIITDPTIAIGIKNLFTGLGVGFGALGFCFGFSLILKSLEMPF